MKTRAVALSLGLFASVVAGWAAGSLPAEQGKENTANPLAGNPKAIERGRANFRIACSYCHGMDARGGLRGPNLTAGHLAHGDTDEAVFRTILRGIPGTQMPANDLSEEETWELVTYLRSLQPKAPAAALPGNATSGEKLFFGDANCSLCHMVRGKGGRLGPDLTRVGAARPVEFLVESIREPDKHLTEGLSEPNRDFPQVYEKVTATLQDGTEFTGVPLNEDSFSIQLLDQSEQLHLLLKKDLKKLVHERKSLMPAYGPDLLNEKQLQDVIAYLSALRGV